MSRGYSLDLRGRVIALVEEGLSRSAAARRLKVAVQTNPASSDQHHAASGDADGGDPQDARRRGNAQPRRGPSPALAPRAVTIDAAWQCGFEKEIGSLEVGKRANIVMVETHVGGSLAMGLVHLVRNGHSARSTRTECQEATNSLTSSFFRPPGVGLGVKMDPRGKKVQREDELWVTPIHPLSHPRRTQVTETAICRRSTGSFLAHRAKTKPR